MSSAAGGAPCRLQPVVAPTPEDEDALAVVRGLSEVLRAASLPAPDAASSGRALQLAPGLLFTGAHGGRRFSRRIEQGIPDCRHAHGLVHG
jgi:hypothetical protein